MLSLKVKPLDANNILLCRITGVILHSFWVCNIL